MTRLGTSPEVTAHREGAREPLQALEGAEHKVGDADPPWGTRRSQDGRAASTRCPNHSRSALLKREPLDSPHLWRFTRVSHSLHVSLLARFRQQWDGSNARTNVSPLGSFGRADIRTALQPVRSGAPQTPTPPARGPSLTRVPI